MYVRPVDRETMSAPVRSTCAASVHSWKQCCTERLLMMANVLHFLSAPFTVPRSTVAADCACDVAIPVEGETLSAPVLSTRAGSSSMAAFAEARFAERWFCSRRRLALSLGTDSQHGHDRSAAAPAQWRASNSVAMAGTRASRLHFYTLTCQQKQTKLPLGKKRCQPARKGASPHGGKALTAEDSTQQGGNAAGPQHGWSLPTARRLQATLLVAANLPLNCTCGQKCDLLTRQQ